LKSNLKAGYLPIGILAAGLKEFDSHTPIVIASRDTLATPKRLDKAGEFTHIVVDEAHHVAPQKSSRYRKIFDYFALRQKVPPYVLGVTATPYRMGQGFIYGQEDHHFFSGVSYKVGIPELIRKGYLSRLAAYAVDEEAIIDASEARVKFKGGDYRESDIEKLAMDDQTMLAIVTDWIDKAYSKGRTSTVFFCVTVEHANKMYSYLKDAGISAAVITAETPLDLRKEYLEKFEDGVINALCNVAVLTEGWDAPRTDCIALLRPTKSLGLYVQICGRGMRPWGQKKDCMLLDYGENMLRHGCIDRARPVTPRDAKEETKDPKVWICVSSVEGDPCLGVNDQEDKKCRECGTDRPPKQIEEQIDARDPDVASSRKAAVGQVLSDEILLPEKERVVIKKVDLVYAEEKVSKNNNRYLSVCFKTEEDFWPHKLPIMFGMNGTAQRMSLKKWDAISRGMPFPKSIDAAIGEIRVGGCLNHIKQITVEKEGKYWNVTQVHF